MLNLRSEKGSALVIVVMITLVLMTLATTNVMMTRFEMQHAQTDVVTQQAFEAAKAGVNYGVAYVRAHASAGYLPGSDELANVDMPDGMMEGYTYFRDTDWETPGIYIDATDRDTVMTISEGEYNGLKAVSRPYRVTSRVKGLQNERALVYQDFYVNFIPIFQFASFYDGDWELHNGPQMTFAGRIHTNSNAYLNSHATTRMFNLTGNSIITAAGRFYNSNHPLNPEGNNGNTANDYFLIPGSDPNSGTGSGNWVRGIDASGEWNGFDGATGVATTGRWWPTHWNEENSTVDFDENMLGIYSPGGQAADPEGENSLVKDRAHGIQPLSLPLPEEVGNIELIKKGEASDIGTSLHASRIYWQAALRVETVPRSEVYYPDTTWAIDRHGTKYRFARDEDLLVRPTYTYYLDEQNQEHPVTYTNFPESQINHKEQPNITNASIWRQPNFVPSTIPDEPVTNDTLRVYYERVDEFGEDNHGETDLGFVPGLRAVVLEAEIFQDHSTGTTDAWQEQADTGLAGWYGTGYMQAVDTNGSQGTYTSANGSRLSYDVYFNTTGTWYVWAYGYGATGNDDAFHIAVGGGTSVEMTVNNGAFGWNNENLSGNPATLTVNNAGLNTINVWVSEDGVALDQILLVHAEDVDGNAVGATYDPDPPSPHILVEAEDFVNFVDDGPGGDNIWEVRTDGDRGAWTGSGYMHVTDNDGNNNNYGYCGDISASTPRLDYQVNFPAAGTWYIYSYACGTGGTSDSHHMGLNNSCMAERISLSGGGNFQWADDNMSNQRISLTVPSAGTHTVNVWQREDGSNIDKFVLSQDQNLDPDNMPDMTPTHRVPTLIAQDFFKSSPDPTKPYMVIEAEQYHHAVSRGDRQWVESDSRVDSDSEGYGGLSYMTTIGSDYTGADYANNSAELIYYVYFDTTGTWTVWNRGHRDGNSSSFHVGLDYVDVTSGEDAEIANAGSDFWAWGNERSGNNTVTLDIDNVGVHTLHVWHERTGAGLDQFVITRPGASVTPSGVMTPETVNVERENFMPLSNLVLDADGGDSGDFYMWQKSYEIGTVRLGGTDVGDLTNTENRHYVVFIKPRDPNQTVNVSNIRLDNPMPTDATSDNDYLDPSQWVLNTSVESGDDLWQDSGGYWDDVDSLATSAYITWSREDRRTKFNHYVKFDVDVPVNVFVGFQEDHSDDDMQSTRWLREGSMGSNMSEFAGFANFYDDNNDVWLSMTNINTENFLSDTLLAVFDNDGALPSGIEIPNDMMIDNSTTKTAYLQAASAFDPNNGTVTEWEVRVLREHTVPMGEGLEDSVFIAVIDVLRDPPRHPVSGKKFDPFGIWAADFREEYLNENMDRFGVGRNANGRMSIQPNQNQVVVCHVPPGNSGNPQTLSVGYSAWFGPAGHQMHEEDYFGECLNDDRYTISNEGQPFQSGVRVYNGDRLADWMDTLGVDSEYRGLTFASENIFFLQGNYNTNGPEYYAADYFTHTYHDPDENNPLPDLPERIPSAIMADVVRLLSTEYATNLGNLGDGWMDARSHIGNRNTRPAEETTYCFAMITGNIETDNGNGIYSGGVHNLARYLEHWGGEDHNWATSIVCLYEGDTAEEFNLNYYSPPNRRWTFDQRFLQVNGWPPLTPLVRDTEGGPWVYDRGSRDF